MHSTPYVPRVLRRSLRRMWLAPVALLGLALAGCHSQEFRTVDITPATTITDSIPEEQLLDVGIAVFDPNVPETYDEVMEQQVNVEVRRAESYYMAYHLKTVVEATGNWGAVRVLPRHTDAVDLIVSGQILQSQGERLALGIQVRDATGTVWFSKSYLSLASKYAYGESLPHGVDPFEPVYTQIADDLASYFSTLSAEARQVIRHTAHMRFAQGLVPVAYEDYVVNTPSGTTTLKRLPARNDPLMHQVRRVREREFLFIDALDDYYADYKRRMYPYYQNWREAAYKQSMAALEMNSRKRQRTFVGTMSIVGGFLGGPATMSGIATGAEMLQSNIHDTDALLKYVDSLQEVSSAMEAEVAPQTLELENRTVTLTGTVEKQYDNLRRLLTESYLRSLGMEQVP